MRCYAFTDRSAVFLSVPAVYRARYLAGVARWVMFLGEEPFWEDEELAPSAA